MRNHNLVAAAISALVCIGSGSPGYAASVDVFQESTLGAGDFSANQLGTIESFGTTGTLAEYYAYMSQQFTNVSSIALTPDQSASQCLVVTWDFLI